MAEHHTVDVGVVGSSPTIHPKKYRKPSLGFRFCLPHPLTQGVDHLVQRDNLLLAVFGRFAELP